MVLPNGLPTPGGDTGNWGVVLNEYLTKNISNVFNVKGFGAVGDGVADDTAAVQATIAAAKAAGGGTIFFPKGTYLLSQSVIIIDFSKCRITGESGAILKGMAGAETPSQMLRIEGTTGNEITDVYVDHLEFDGNGDAHGDLGNADPITLLPTTSTQAHIINIHTASRVTISNCYLHDSPGDSICLDVLGIEGPSHVTISNNRLYRCRRNGITCHGTHINIVDNDIDGYNTVGIDLEPDTDMDMSYINIRGNIIRPNPTFLSTGANTNRIYGISLQNNLAVSDKRSNISVTENKIYGLTDAGVQYPQIGIRSFLYRSVSITSNQIFECRQGIMSSSEPTDDASRGVIANNVIRSFKGGSANPAVIGIGVRSNMIVSGNICEEGEGAGIFVLKRNNVIIGNICHNNGQYTGAGSVEEYRSGIVFEDGPGNICEGNLCYDDQSTKTQTYGIYIINDINSPGPTLIGNNVGANSTFTDNRNALGGIRLSNITGTIKDNIGFKTNASGAALSVSDDTTISHTLDVTPSSVIATGSIAGEIITVVSITATDFTVSIKNNTGSSGTPQTIYWEARA